MYDREYTRKVRKMWIYGGHSHPADNMQLWIEHLRQCNPSDFMTARERKKFAALPDTFTVYRGVRPVFGTPVGLSWTLDRKVAEWFALDESTNTIGTVYERTVSKTDVFAYVVKESGTWNEHEIILREILEAAVRDRAKVTA